MDLARVIGSVVATERDPAFGSLRLALVQPLNEARQDSGRPYVAIDAINCNVGEIVFMVRSGDAMMGHPGEDLVPTDAAIGGIVDSVYVEKVP